MGTDFAVLIVAMVLLFVVGMAIFLVWKLMEPRSEGKSRSLMDFLVKPAATMAGGVALLGIYIVFPRALLWTFGVLVVLAVVELIRMPASQKGAVARAIKNPDPTSRWSATRLILAAVIVFTIMAGLVTIFVPQ